MAALPTTPIAASITTVAGTALKDGNVPYEQRESQNVNWKPWAWKIFKFAIIAKLSALAGELIGRAMKMPKAVIGDIEMPFNNMSLFGGALGGIYESYELWMHGNSKRMAVKDIAGDMHKAFDPALLEREVQKQQEITQRLKRLEELQSRPHSHSADVLARRETEEHTAGRSA